MSEGNTPTPAAAGTPAPAPAAAPAPAEPNAGATPPTGTLTSAPGEPPAGVTPAKPEVKAGAPEKYEAFKLPDGFKLDDASMAEFMPVAKGLNLTQEQAQQLIDLQTKLVTKASTDADALWTKTLSDWKSAVMNDKDLGGPNLTATIAACGKAIDKFGGKELREALEYTGAGNHPAVIKFLAAVGKQISEDTLHVGNANANPEADLAKRLFPNMN
jgi:hypothetical protein